MFYYDIKESGKRIKELRKQKGLTQEELAEKLNISYSMVGKIEIGYTGISIDLLIQLVVLFEVSMEYIILGQEITSRKVREQIDFMAEQFSVLQKMMDINNSQ